MTEALAAFMWPTMGGLVGGFILSEFHRRRSEEMLKDCTKLINALFADRDRWRDAYEALRKEVEK